MKQTKFAWNDRQSSDTKNKSSSKYKESPTIFHNGPYPQTDPRHSITCPKFIHKQIESTFTQLKSGLLDKKGDESRKVVSPIRFNNVATLSWGR